MKATVTVCLLIATYLCCYGQSIILVPQEHQTIQAALNSANAGDSIIVSPGVYTETITWPMATDSIVLQSTDGPHCTVVDANHNGRPLSIVGDGFFDDEESLGSATVVDSSEPSSQKSHHRGQSHKLNEGRWRWVVFGRIQLISHKLYNQRKYNDI